MRCFFDAGECRPSRAGFEKATWIHTTRDAFANLPHKRMQPIQSNFFQMRIQRRPTGAWFVRKLLEMPGLFGFGGNYHLLCRLSPTPDIRPFHFIGFPSGFSLPATGTSRFCSGLKAKLVVVSKELPVRGGIASNTLHLLWLNPFALPFGTDIYERAQVRGRKSVPLTRGAGSARNAMSGVVSRTMGFLSLTAFENGSSFDRALRISILPLLLQ